MPTKEQLEEENAALRAENEELRAGKDAAAIPRVPQRLTNEAGDTILSAGEANDLEQFGVTRSPFTGETLNALDEGITPGNPDAKRAAEKERTTRGDKPANVSTTDVAHTDLF
jgi:hypothetical protein